jgi:hypothetical protein
MAPCALLVPLVLFPFALEDFFGPEELLDSSSEFSSSPLLALDFLGLDRASPDLPSFSAAMAPAMISTRKIGIKCVTLIKQIVSGVFILSEAIKREGLDASRAEEQFVELSGKSPNEAELRDIKIWQTILYGGRRAGQSSLIVEPRLPTLELYLDSREKEGENPF